MTNAAQKIAGAILAGGKASRLSGIAKGALATADGRSIVDRLIAEMSAAGIEDIVVVANDASPYAGCGREIIADLRAGVGPLGGIESALSHFAGRAVAFLPCDLPRITASEISVLIDSFNKQKTGIVYASAGFFCHPLCAVVHNDAAQKICSAIDSGKRGVQKVWGELGAVPCSFDNEDAFLNVNTPAELGECHKRGLVVKAKIFVPENLRESVQQLINTEQIGIELTGDRNNAVIAVEEGEKRESGLSVIYAGGWISCQTARALAQKLHVPVPACGKLLKLLNVKIRQCGLGCF